VVKLPDPLWQSSAWAWKIQQAAYQTHQQLPACPSHPKTCFPPFPRFLYPLCFPLPAASPRFNLYLWSFGSHFDFFTDI
jgi:hypothetical protein